MEAQRGGDPWYTPCTCSCNKLFKFMTGFPFPAYTACRLKSTQNSTKVMVGVGDRRLCGTAIAGAWEFLYIIKLSHASHIFYCHGAQRFHWHVLTRIRPSFLEFTRFDLYMLLHRCQYNNARYFNNGQDTQSKCTSDPQGRLPRRG
jgi:hypothetical protein